jgi:exosome complex RNA-binding protein Rrp42 (RNase PH superfamily)
MYLFIYLFIHLWSGQWVLRRNIQKTRTVQGEGLCISSSMNVVSVDIPVLMRDGRYETAIVLAHVSA